MKYIDAPDIKALVDEMVNCLSLNHIEIESVHCYRSVGSKSKRTIARIHGLERSGRKH